MGILGLGDTWRRRPLEAPVPAEPTVSPEPALSAEAAEKLPRRFGDFLLTSRLGQDPLGSVYRGLALGETGDFLRIRILDSPELPRERLLEIMRRATGGPPPRVSPHRPRGEKLGASRGIPYLAWSEMHGWTLDALMRELRRRGRRLPLEHVLLIIDGIARALETHGLHGLVWPGFVSVSRDGEVRLAGFDLSPAILSALDSKPVFETIGPYLAPEVREERIGSVEGDVFSLGVVALELLTDFPSAFPGMGRGMGAERLFPNELARLLRVALGKRKHRFASVGDLRRELGQFMVSSRRLPSSFHLARYLRDLDSTTRPAADSTPEGAPGSETAMPEVPVIPVLEESEIEMVLQRFWGQIEK